MAQRIDVQYIKFYTHGSAAARVAPVRPMQTGTLPRARKRTVYRICVDPVAIFGIAVAVCMLIMMAAGVWGLQREQRATVEMERYVSRLQQENETLRARYEEERDLEALRQNALALGMVPRDQIESTVITVPAPVAQAQVQSSLWSRIGTFLTGLFA